MRNDVRRLIVWVKTRKDPGLDPTLWRRDVYGRLMFLHDYGQQSSPYGWTIDLIDPRAGDDMGNLQALHWENTVKQSNRRFREILVSLLPQIQEKRLGETL